MKIIYLFHFLFLVNNIYSQCFNNCNQHGKCNINGKCDCFNGYTGSDCSLRTCPLGPQFADIAYTIDKAHQEAECSGHGFCDRKTGNCLCDTAYAGADCSRNDCPNQCSNHGNCISLKTAASTYDGWSLNHTTTYNRWDKNLMFGCQCESGWVGYDCSQKVCDYGPDPRLSNTGKETVTFVCDCGSACSGKFLLQYLGIPTSSWLTPSSTGDDLAAALLYTVGYYYNSTYGNDYITALVNGVSSSLPICSSSAVRTTKISFMRRGGDRTALSLYRMNITDGDMYFKTTQEIVCDCTPECDGSINIVYDGEISGPINILDDNDYIYNALYAMVTPETSAINVGGSLRTMSIVPNGASAKICSYGVKTTHTIEFLAPMGNLPRLEIISSAVKGADKYFYDTVDITTDEVFTVLSDDGRNEGVKICNGVGTCDYSTGNCICDFGWEIDVQYGPCGRPQINSSDWNGVARCPGATSLDGNTDLSATSNQQKLYVSMNPIWNPASTINNVSIIEMYYYDDNGNIHLTPQELEWYGYGIETKYPRIHKNFSVETVHYYTSNTSAGPIAIDRHGSYLYYADNNDDAPFIGRMVLNVNGTLATSSNWLYTTGKVFGIAFDLTVTRRRIYWSVPSTYKAIDGGIFYASLDDPTPNAVSITLTIGGGNVVDPRGIAYHYLEKRIYWVDYHPAYQCTVLNSCDDDGANFKRMISYRSIHNISSVMNATGIVIDFKNNTLYMMDEGSVKSIVSTNLNFPLYLNYTSNSTRDYDDVHLYFETLHVPIENPEYLILDNSDTEDFLLWTDSGTNTLSFFDIRREVLSKKFSSVLREYAIKSPIGIALDRGMNDLVGKHLDCFGNGRCTGEAGNWECECYSGYFGNCNMQSCPTGKAWFNEPRQPNVAHDKFVECSNKGSCNYNTGECDCQKGYEGPACERNTCPVDDDGVECSGNGKCLTMRQLATYRRKKDMSLLPAEYGSKYNDPNTWDADMIRGCYADLYGSHPLNTNANITSMVGSDLSQYSCPYGYSTRIFNPGNQTRTPLKGNKAARVENQREKQLLSCEAGNGGFELSFRGKKTETIRAQATSAQLKAALEALPTIGEVSLTGYSSNSPADTVCSLAQNNWYINFDSEMGSLPLISVVSKDASILGLTITRENEGSSRGNLFECSNHGDCDRTTGECICWPFRTSSDGFGNQGSNGDCGFNNVF